MRRQAMTTCLTVLILLLLVPSAYAQRGSALRVDGDRIKSYIEFLCTDEFEGRQSCTESFRRAADWVAAKYEEWGLKPAGENGTYFQRVPITRGVNFSTGVPELYINGTAFSAKENDFSVNDGMSTAATNVNAEVVFAGYGISAPDKGLDEYDGLDVRGKVVLILTGNPNDAPVVRPRMGGAMPMVEEPAEPAESWEEESRTAAKIETAYNKGAAAILLYNPDAEAQAGMRFRRGEAAEFTPSRDFLAFTVTARVFHAVLLQDPQESTGGFDRRLANMRQAIKNMEACSVNTGVRARLKGYDSVEVYSEEKGNNYARNVIAKLEGTDRRLRGQYVIMGGHLDHLGVRNGLVYNGADDNASGACTAMEVARVLSEANFRPRRTIIFCAWCGEELGLIGSTYYVGHPTDGVTMDNVVTYFNMDMVGLGDAIGAPGALNFPSIWEVIKRDQDEDVISAVQPSTGGSGGSDHSAFITLGIEAMALMTRGGGGHPDYHQPEDDTEKIEPEILRKTGQFVLQGTINLANERSVNLLIPDRQTIFNITMLRITSFNPGVEDSPYRSAELHARNKDELVGVVMDSALAVYRRTQQQSQTTPQQPMMMGRGFGGQPRSRRSFNNGLSDLSPFEGDIELLLGASEFIGFGRIDIGGDDGTWVSGGRLTRQGRSALAAMEENNITVHLASPSESLLRDMVGAASRPFLVTGSYTVPFDLVDQINEKNILLGVTMDPQNLDACISGLEALKNQLGDTNNLFLCATTNEGLDDAKQALYYGLVEKGFTHEEIAGSGGRQGGGGIAGGNLSGLTRGAGRRFRP